ncbi:uncharacterized protein SPPG_01777 [Spizellomyces punctatus DAOM BR117]|uniref:Gamma-soluble NSF attachment protein n=1 Tax=Spizellomyces punctatus (strain DAOM BR117) TaxID=645134 RepID=A0A0L0HNN8_SPIPD|nr:uncharacterized protein SPPG_01777 [Spizellomyces punctatus DAOM BR117]KND02692.1 hypothetical protein SPPG_01777 [Spizellomyces punctatus DAOM BR117]|eukprot:XP_016610731.1 hypothetical protein SPPG_01777 [Spizellomyces punctatus DAOM BR117]
MSDAKVKEGLAYLADGEKARSKKSLFGKPKPDWDVAVQNYEAAANCFRNAKCWDYTVEAYMKAAEAHRNLDSLFLAAKSLELAAAILVQQLKKPDEASDLYRQTSQYFLAQGSPDRAGEALEKAAKAVEATDIGKCIELYDESCKIFEEENKLRFGVETFKRAIAVSLRHRRYDKALELSRRLCDAFTHLEQRPNFCKQALSTVIILLAMGDEVGATKQLEMYGSINGFAQAEEGVIAQGILEAMQTGDEDSLSAAMKKTPVQFLDNEVTRIGRELRVPGGAKGISLHDKPASEAVKQLQEEVEEEGFL